MGAPLLYGRRWTIVAVSMLSSVPGIFLLGRVTFGVRIKPIHRQAMIKPLTTLLCTPVSYCWKEVTSVSTAQEPAIPLPHV